jgi:hypothetical protein
VLARGLVINAVKKRFAHTQPSFNIMKGFSMKRFSFVVAVVVSALVLGCQDSNMTNPISNDFAGAKAPAFSRPNGSLPDGSYDFKVQLNSRPAEAANGEYEVTGSVQYVLVQSGDETYELALVTRGTAEHLQNGSSGSFYGESIDYVTMPGKGSAKVEKSYVIEGLDQALKLHISFAVSETEVTVEKMWLAEGADSGKLGWN